MSENIGRCPVLVCAQRIRSPVDREQVTVDRYVSVLIVTALIELVIAPRWRLPLFKQLVGRL